MVVDGGGAVGAAWGVLVVVGGGMRTSQSFKRPWGEATARQWGVAPGSTTIPAREEWKGRRDCTACEDRGGGIHMQQQYT